MRKFECFAYLTISCITSVNINMHAMYTLHKAIRYGDFNEAQVLIKNPDTNINEKDNEKRTPLHCAVIARSLQMVELLLQRTDILVNKRCNPIGCTPLHYAIIKDLDEIARALLTHQNIDIGKKNRLGATPLQYAKEDHKYELVKMLEEAEQKLKTQ